MATAKRPGGLYWVDGKPVDAEGKAVENAPPLEQNTVVDRALLERTAEERSADRLGEAIASALTRAAVPAAKAPKAAPVSTPAAEQKQDGSGNKSESENDKK